MKKPRTEPTLTTIALPEQLPSWGVLVLESHHAPDFTMDWRTHSFIKVIYALSGKGRVLIGDSQHSFGPRDVIVVPPRHKNRIIDDEGSAASLYVFCLATNLIRFDRQLLDRMNAGVLRSSLHFANQVQQRLRRLLFEQTRGREVTPVTMVGDGIQLLSLLAQQPPASDKIGGGSAGDQEEVLVYIEHLKNHFFEATTIDAAADQLGLARRRFTSLFKQLTGESWLAYVRRLCIEHAKTLLRDTTLPITSVAFECGFDDLSTFYRQFKRQTGLAPGVWRDQNA